MTWSHNFNTLHSIEKWTGQFFNTTSLDQEGFILLYLGYDGEPCPSNHLGRSGQETPTGSSDEDDWEDRGKGEGENDGEGVPLAGWEKKDGQCLVIVDTSGVHQLHIGWCRFKTAAEPHIQLLRNWFFPASVKRPSTTFTFSLLDYFYIDSVERKTSASSFFSKLCRLTNNYSPHSVPVCFRTSPALSKLTNLQDRYKELMCVSHSWRDIAVRIQAGYGHNTGELVTPGSFLPYLPPAWYQPSQRLERWQRRVGNDMVEPTRYEAHLHNAPDHREVGVLSYMILERLINFLRNLLVPTIRQ